MSPEAFVGEILVRVGFSLLACGLAIAALIVAVRTRTTDYPAKLANDLKELDADVNGFDLKLDNFEKAVKSLNGRLNAIIRHHGGAQTEAAGEPATPAPAAPVAPVAGVAPALPPSIARMMSPGTRAAMGAAGIDVGGNGA